MKGIKRFLWFLYQCFAFYTLLIYTMILWVPFSGWLAGFMMMSFPVVVLVHLVSLPIWFTIEKRKALLPLALLAGSALFLPRTYAFNNERPADTETGKKTLRLMSYNAHVFRKNSEWWKEPAKARIQEMQQWIGESGADVLCMPEYLDQQEGLFDNNGFFSRKGYKYQALYQEERKKKEYCGLAILSKYPIIATRDTIFEAQNGMIQADIKVGRDTVRVIGLHLYSMTLSLGKLVEQKKMDGIEREGRTTVGKMKNGFKQRAEELVRLQTWIDASPYPVIITGDFNEVPYGYVYGKLRKNLQNSFEQKGEGFGFTFNQLPYFIRIDHQFYDDKRLLLTDFKTFSEISYSDHNPIMGTYIFK